MDNELKESIEKLYKRMKEPYKEISDKVIVHILEEKNLYEIYKAKIYDNIFVTWEGHKIKINCKDEILSLADEK